MQAHIFFGKCQYKKKYTVQKLEIKRRNKLSILIQGFIGLFTMIKNNIPIIIFFY